MKIRSLPVALAALCLVAPLHAQPNVLPAPGSKAKVRTPIPMINPQAKELVDAMVARYQKLTSYSDTVRVELEGGAGMPGDFRRGFPVAGKLVWERPARFRFEGTTGGKAFLALSDEDTIHAISPEHPGYYIERRQFETMTGHPDGTTTPYGSQLNNAAMEANVPALGISWMTDPQPWAHMLQDITVVALEADADTGGEACRVVNIQAQGDQNETSLIRLWIAKSDGLLRRMELSSNFPGVTFKMIETHAHVTLNPALPAATWAWVAPDKAKPVENFSLLHPYKTEVAFKVGDALPVFSGDALDGKPLELNSKDGKVMLLHFFMMSNGLHDVRTLERLQQALGAKGLRVVGVSGDGRRKRVEKFVQENGVSFPIFFEETGMRNRMAHLFGVRGWATTLIYGRDGRLQTIAGSTYEADLLTGLQKLFPDNNVGGLINARDDAAPAEAR